MFVDRSQNSSHSLQISTDTENEAMSGKGKSAGGRGHGKALGTPQESRVTRKRKETTTEHVEGQAPGEKTGAAKQQEPGPSREGKRKRQGTVLGPQKLSVLINNLI